MKAAIFNISRCCVDDGPGIRTTVFIKGCPLHCVWCHNPESQCRMAELTYNPQKCTLCGRCATVCPVGAHLLEDGTHTFLREKCTACGKCAEACYAEALSMVGKDMTADEVLAEAVRDRVFYQNSGGGVTLSGGEPLSHPEFTEELLTKLRAEGIHTAMETCGFASKAIFERIAPLCDLLLFDLKETDPKRNLDFTGVPLEPILANLRRADELGIKIHLRLPIIPGLNDRDDHFEKAGKIAKTLKNLVRAQIMPYHKLGAYKYATLGREYSLSDVEEPDEETKRSWQDKLDSFISN